MAILRFHLADFVTDTAEVDFCFVSAVCDVIALGIGFDRCDNFLDSAMFVGQGYSLISSASPKPNSFAFL
jgi:hypothetical protein